MFADVVVSVKKVEGDGSAARAVDDPPIGEFPRVGKDGYQYHRKYGKWRGGVTSGPEREIPFQVEVELGTRLRHVRNG